MHQLRQEYKIGTSDPVTANYRANRLFCESKLPRENESTSWKWGDQNGIHKDLKLNTRCRACFPTSSLFVTENLR